MKKYFKRGNKSKGASTKALLPDEGVRHDNFFYTLPHLFFYKELALGGAHELGRFSEATGSHTQVEESHHSRRAVLSTQAQAQQDGPSNLGRHSISS